jgi:diguanylate cyclase (GGDEF)-like protein
MVLFIDLDRFKNVNDTAGHNAGDQVLRECAQRLSECLRESDTVARSGGDEFLVLIESSDQPHVSAIAQKILTAMSRPFRVSGKEFDIGASIGISTYPIDGTDVETLIRQADIAMYRVKMEGKNNFCYYSPSMSQHSLERYAMESSLRHALERGEMELYYQPKIDLADGSISGAEALIRWNHPKYGTLLPSRFIPLAEEIGVITKLGSWAIHEACTNCRSWQQLGLPPIRIAVNFAYPQFSDEHLFSSIKELLESSKLKPDVLELEITESMAMENAERLMHSLQQIKQLGVHLTIDDFGTGYSSLAYLKRLPVDSVKVDRSFIRDLPGDSDDAAITHAILALVHSLKRQVIAEGVETREQLQFLIDEGCDSVQGFYFSPALPAEKFRELLTDRKTFMM